MRAKDLKKQKVVEQVDSSLKINILTCIEGETDPPHSPFITGFPAECVNSVEWEALTNLCVSEEGRIFVGEQIMYLNSCNFTVKNIHSVTTWKEYNQLQPKTLNSNPNFSR